MQVFHLVPQVVHEAWFHLPQAHRLHLRQPVQFSNVRFGGEASSSFSVSNGVGQGKILAGFVYCFYCHEFFEMLNNSDYDCFVNDVYAGVYCYSNDNLLLAPTYTALAAVINIAESYFSTHGLQFSTNPDPRKSKTKCIA